MSSKYEKEAIAYLFYNMLAGSSVVMIGLIILLFTVLGTLTWWIIGPLDLHHKHRMNVSSLQYQEARKESILTHQQEIERLSIEIAKTKNPQLKKALQSQKRVLQKRVEREKARLQ